MIYDAGTTLDFIMPEDIGRIITEYVGHEFISQVKRTLFQDRREVVCEEVETALATWTKTWWISHIRSHTTGCV